jgi:hypothetical protein
VEADLSALFGVGGALGAGLAAQAVGMLTGPLRLLRHFILAAENSVMRGGQLLGLCQPFPDPASPSQLRARDGIVGEHLLDG